MLPTTYYQNQQTPLMKGSFVSMNKTQISFQDFGDHPKGQQNGGRLRQESSDSGKRVGEH